MKYLQKIHQSKKHGGTTENTGNIGFEETHWKSADKLRGSMNAEVIEEQIRMSHEIRRMKEWEVTLGLREVEIAFYDALKTIAHELTLAIRNNVTIEEKVL